jgi:hypothetical protein
VANFYLDLFKGNFLNQSAYPITDPLPDAKSRSVALTPIKTYILEYQKSKIDYSVKTKLP